jgi:hypothetical protein
MNGNGNGHERTFRNPMLWLALIVQLTVVLAYAIDMRGDLEQVLAEQSNRRGMVYEIPQIRQDVLQVQRDIARLDQDGTRLGRAAAGDLARLEQHVETLDQRIVNLERRIGWRPPLDNAP